MINFQLFGLVRFWLLLKEHEDIAFSLTRHEALDRFAEGTGAEMPESRLSEDFLKAVQGDFVFAKQLCRQLELEASANRISRFERRLKAGIDTAGVAAELRALREAIDDELNHRHFYHYPRDRAAVLLKLQPDWEAVLKQFPLAKEDITAAVDCWALGHSTASVFHLMRVAESGLRALARERRVKLPKKQPLEWAEWRTVIEGIGKKAELIANKKRGPARDAALEFYRGALVSFEGFKDAYRNNVMHSRRSYQPKDALALMHHVREFMTRLSSRLDETGTKQIKWGIR